MSTPCRRSSQAACYMLNYFSMMMAISSIFLTLDGSKEALAKRRQLWDDLKAHDGHLYRRCRFSVGGGLQPARLAGSKISIGGYRIAQKYSSSSIQGSFIVD